MKYLIEDHTVHPKSQINFTKTTHIMKRNVLNKKLTMFNMMHGNIKTCNQTFYFLLG
jgi:hypothetical protein